MAPSICRSNYTDGASITSVFDGGNVEVIRFSPTEKSLLKIIPDPWSTKENTSHLQWFSFKVAGVKGRDLTFEIVNAGEASYPTAWKGYSVAATYDSVNWFRVATTFDASSGVLSFSHIPEHSKVHYSYFAPFGMERHAALVQGMQMHASVTHHVLGHTLDGRDMDLLQVGTPEEGKRNIWIIARQHPGETMAEWFMEGLFNRLVDPADPISHGLLTKAVFYCVPNMCPDGSARGHLRTNAGGANLNRHWDSPDPSIAPEVACTLERMKQTGVDMLMDIHGDEELPYCFVFGMEGLPCWDARVENIQTSFKEAFQRHSPDFQTTYGYPQDSPGKANLTTASKQVGERFKALSLTLEMPFKDTANQPRPEVGWTPQRAARLGAAMLGAVLEVVPILR